MRLPSRRGGAGLGGAGRGGAAQGGARRGGAAQGGARRGSGRRAGLNANKSEKTSHYLVKLTNVNSITRVGRHRLLQGLQNARLRLHTITPVREVVTQDGRRIIEQSGKVQGYYFDCLPSRTLARLKVLAPSLVKSQSDEFKIRYQYQKHQRFKHPDLPLKNFYRRVVRRAKSLLVRRAGLRSLNALFADEGYNRGFKIKSRDLAERIRQYLGVSVNLTRKSNNVRAEIRILLDLNFEMIDHIEQRGLDDVRIKI